MGSKVARWPDPLVKYSILHQNHIHIMVSVYRVTSLKERLAPKPKDQVRKSHPMELILTIIP